jgi:hypothetical protein
MALCRGDQNQILVAGLVVTRNLLYFRIYAEIGGGLLGSTTTTSGTPRQ